MFLFKILHALNESLIALIMTPVLSMIFIPLQRLIWQIFVLLLMPFF